MGAHSFGYYVKTQASAVEAYRSETEHATHEHGYDGYNGTISTTAGVQEFTGTPLTEAEASRRAEALIDAHEVEKWGYAGALAVYEPEAKHVRKVTRSIKLTGEQLRDNNRRGSLYLALRELIDSITPEGLVREGERMVEHSIVTKPGGFGTEVDAVYKTRVITEATEGTKQTRYFITGGQYEHRARAWANGFASQAEARAALTEALKGGTPESWGGGEVEYGIVAESRRENGDPLVRSRREIISVTVKVEFTLVKKVVAPKRTGWYLFGIAAE